MKKDCPLFQHDWCPYKKTQKNTQEKCHVKIQAEIKVMLS